MPKEKNKNLLCVDDLRHAEYYSMQETFDELYAKSKNGEIFTDIMGIILSRENILLAYRNIKTNRGSHTPGTDNLTIEHIGRLSPDVVVERVNQIIFNKHGYTPRPVRRKDIPKPNGSTRPLGIPCIWDRLIQQCIKQVMEPICEAKFSNNSYGFRPDRSVEQAIQKTYKLMQVSNLHYVIEVDIKGFFDNVDHSKLIKQMWSLGIHDKHLIYIIRKILKAPIMMPSGEQVLPTKGTPQGGIISPLLANIVLNELDHWIESQWQNNPVVNKYVPQYDRNGQPINSNAYKGMRRTGLKEMFIVRYADDFRIFCRTRKEAVKTMLAVVQWLQERLKLQVSEEKTRIVNVKRQYTEFLGFKIKLHHKGNKEVVKSRMCEKALKKQKEKLSAQAKRIAKPRDSYRETGEIRLYNSMVLGIHNYYQIATHVNLDCSEIAYKVERVLYNRLATAEGNRLVKTGRKLTAIEQQRYGISGRLRYVAGSGEPVYPMSFVQHRNPKAKSWKANRYTKEGRIGLHDNLRLNIGLMTAMMLQPVFNCSIEFADNRISLYTAQWGKCAVTGLEFQTINEIHCHHICPKCQGGTDGYNNLILVLDLVHRLIHSTQIETIQHYMKLLNLDNDQLNRLNKYREKIGNTKIES